MAGRGPQAQQRLIHAEHEADVARAAFHRAVQRLVLHGAEPQDVAAALGISDRQLYERRTRLEILPARPLGRA